MSKIRLSQLKSPGVVAVPYQELMSIKHSGSGVPTHNMHVRTFRICVNSLEFFHYELGISTQWDPACTICAELGCTEPQGRCVATDREQGSRAKDNLGKPNQMTDHPKIFNTIIDIAGVVSYLRVVLTHFRGETWQEPFLPTMPV